jgi:hypothetical protein
MDVNIYHKVSDGWYACGCGYDTPIMDTSHISNEIRGYCNYGMKAIADNKYQCICGKILDDSIVGKRHVRNSVCSTKAIEYERYTCKVCDIECHNTYTLKKHKQTTRHKNKVDDPLFCNICDIRCLSKALMETHIKTKKHQNMVASGKIAEEKISLHCETCNITCPSQATMKTHLQTNKHLKKTDSFSSNTLHINKDNNGLPRAL